MSTFLFLRYSVLHSFLFLLVVRGNKSNGSLSQYGEPIGPLGPTIVEKPYNVNDDVDAFKKGIDDKNLDPIVELIAGRTLTQRLAIAAAYKKKFPTTNVTIDINSVLSQLGKKKSQGPEDLFKGFFIPLPEFLARRIQGSLDLKHHWTYMSIICTSSATRMKAIVISYSKVYMRELRDELDKQLNDVEGKQALQKMVDPRYVRPDYGSDSKLVDSQLNYIPSDTVQCDNNTDLFILMTTQSFQQLKLVSQTFEQRNSKTKVVDMFRKHCSKGDLQEIYKRIIRYASDPYEYYAEEYDLGMDDNDLNSNAQRYIITSRNEVDLKDIMKAYYDKYNKDTIEVIMNDWHDTEYRKLFVAVLKGNT